MFVVTKNNPFYPEVEYFETIEEANIQRDEWFNGMNTPAGEYDCIITVARVLESKPFKSEF